MYRDPIDDTYCLCDPGDVFSWEDPDDDVELLCGANDGGVKRGDRADTGDNEARPVAGVGRKGSGVRGGGDGPGGQPTAVPSSLGANSTVSRGSTDNLGEDIDGMSVVDAADPRLGMTNVGGRGPGDWAADTGPSVSGDGRSGVATVDINDDGSALGGDRPRNQPPADDSDEPLARQSDVRGDRTLNRTKIPNHRG